MARRSPAGCDKDEVVPLDSAQEFFNDLIRREPNNLAAYTARGIVAKEFGDYDRAIADHVLMSCSTIPSRRPRT